MSKLEADSFFKFKASQATIKNLSTPTLGSWILIGVLFLITLIFNNYFDSIILSKDNKKTEKKLFALKRLFFIKLVFFLAWAIRAFLKSEAAFSEFKNWFIVSTLFDIYIFFTISCKIIMPYFYLNKPANIPNIIKCTFIFNAIYCIFLVILGVFELNSTHTLAYGQLFNYFFFFSILEPLLLYLFYKISAKKIFKLGGFTLSPKPQTLKSET